MYLSHFKAVSTKIRSTCAKSKINSLSYRHPLQLRFLSSSSSSSSTDVSISQPTAITKDMAYGFNECTKLFMKHGIGMQKLDAISKESGNVDTLVTRWQRMMEAYLGTQVHVLAGLGYPANESGLHLYNQHMNMFVQSAGPSVQEELRLANRDLWRYVLSTSFNVSLDEISKKDISIVDARNMMHKVSLKMIEPAILESIALKCSSLKSTGNHGIDIAQKHQVVQETLVNDVYIGGEPPIVTECGFEPGEKGYVAMQCVMAEFSADPLIAQYISSSMMQVLKSAGIDMSEIQKAGEAMKS